VKFESYTPGHHQNAVNFMAERSIESHGQFFAPYLKSGISVLDCGCGPGTITLGIAARVKPGQVIGVDCEQSQIDRARADATNRGIANAAFHSANVYSLPFDDEHFNRVFSHALMEHLADPTRVLKECFRVLKPGGLFDICSPDWAGFLFSPPSPELAQAVDAYMPLTPIL
jgi:ubiquinone/menaquinone biosynthesis C-methylase UbiE